MRRSILLRDGRSLSSHCWRFRGTDSELTENPEELSAPFTEEKVDYGLLLL